MEIDSAMLAMGAEANANGVLHIFSGGFDAVEVAGFPGMLPPFWIVARAIKHGVTEVESHTFEIAGVNPVGERFNISSEGGIKFTLRPPLLADGPSRSSLLTQVMMGAKHEGIYKFLLSIDGKEMKELLLQIKMHVEVGGGS